MSQFFRPKMFPGGMPNVEHLNCSGLFNNAKQNPVCTAPLAVQELMNVL
jgi:hypothetical protein